MSRRCGPVGDKGVPCTETILKLLNYCKEKAPQQSIKEFNRTLSEFKKAYRNREGEDWSRFYNWGSSDHQAQLAEATREFLEAGGTRFWPEDPTQAFYNKSLVWPRDKVRITELTKQLLYRKVHRSPEVPRYKRKVGKRKQAPMDSAPKAAPPDKVVDDARSTTAARVTMSPPAQTEPGPSEPIPRRRSIASPQPRAPEAVMEEPEGQKVKLDIVLRFDRIADAFKEPVMEPSFEPIMETPVTESARKTPAPAVEFKYMAIRSSNHSLEGKTWPSTSLGVLKEDVARHFRNGGGNLTGTLVGGHFRWRYPIGPPTNEDQFAKLEREFRKRINQFGSQREELMVGSEPEPLCFDIMIERNDDEKRSRSAF
ncbi:hypothetical protein ACRE_070300 [Hapsidospora chrysogenum ATCC 11550]|uniref:Uncharacterized protein n=1 Tax=Hapsidospora chrysogenum (strain ATCC 11550 / CBS 779.69 / DSM 880 / IAM 14645 / JCM 23072 / IMI 49137) TaxID=857340 RepID=A0A086SYP9_HAPC1|nr:hypothetical protein ACRE_070300 [Hapsidospora chrysogenum ATCC 11550]